MRTELFHSLTHYCQSLSITCETFHIVVVCIIIKWVIERIKCASLQVSVQIMSTEHKRIYHYVSHDRARFTCYKV